MAACLVGVETGSVGGRGGGLNFLKECGCNPFAIPPIKSRVYSSAASNGLVTICGTDDTK